MNTRFIVGLKEAWQFQTDADRSGISQQWCSIGLPEARSVQIPHTWNVDQGLEEYRGLAWYSYDLEISEAWQGKLLRLQFDAIYRDADVWLNGQKVGAHYHSGYTAFVLDITPYVRYGQANRLVVSVNNENSELALPIRNSFDWADDGGIIRDVSLIVTGKIAIDYLKIDANPFFADHSMAVDSGAIQGEAWLWGKADEDNLPISVKLMIWHENKLMASDEYDLLADKGMLRLKPLVIAQPKLWHFDHPHLYTVQIILLSDGIATDQLSLCVGFRELKTVGNELLLNREPVRLMGVEWMPGSHPDKGMAETEADLIEVLKQIKHANCIITRFHWQQSSRLLDWCDRNGLLVQEEIPHWQQPSEPDDNLLVIAKQHAEEMITRHYNHPCIYAWGMGNEVNGQDAQTIRYMKQLKQYILTLDGNRLINYVSNSVHFKPESDATGVGDLLMWNDYIGTWHGGLDMEEVIHSIDEAFPDKPLVVAEYGLCEPAYTGGDPRRIEILQEKTKEYRKHKGIAALIFFSLNDYRTQMGEEGSGRLRQRVHGTTDVYGKPKPSYQALREIGAPLSLQEVFMEDDLTLTVVLGNRNDIPSYSISGYQLVLAMEEGTETILDIPPLAPGESCQLSLPIHKASLLDTCFYSINRPTGFSVANGLLPISVREQQEREVRLE